jgi:hypothetical protein
MIFDIVYFVPIVILVINLILIIKKANKTYTKVFVNISNLWLLLFILNNYFELWIYFFSIDIIVVRESVIADLYEGFLIISVITLLYNILVVLLKKIYKVSSLDYITLFSNFMSILVVFFVYELLKFILSGNLENTAIKVLFISNLLYGTLFLVGNSLLTVGINLKGKNTTDDHIKTIR